MPTVIAGTRWPAGQTITWRPACHLDLTAVHDPDTAYLAYAAAWPLDWPGGCTIECHPDGRWTAWLAGTGETFTGCRYSHRDVHAVRDMIAAAAQTAEGRAHA